MKITLDIDIETHRDKALSTAVFNLFKRRGFPANVLRNYWDRYPAEYLCRMYWLWEYKLSEDPPRNPIAWIRTMIEHEHPLPEMFHFWWKVKQPQILKGNYSADAKKVAGVV